MTTLALSAAGLIVLFAAWLRAAGTAITRVTRADALRDASDNVDGAATVAELLDNREAITPAVGVVASAFLVVGAVIGTAVLARRASVAGALVVAIGVGLLAFLIGDLIPRRLGRLNPAGLAYRSHVLLSWSVGLGGWANDLLPEVDNGFEEAETQDEEADEHERELIDSVLEFGETIVREVMTPRPDMITINVTGSIRELIELATDAGFSRIPVTSDGDVVGMVIVKDLLRMLTDDRARPDSVAQVMRPVEFVPETKLAAALLAEMQESHTHQVIVVDEYGDVAGLVTIEDLLEELVGEIADETDSEEALIHPRGDGWWVDARLPVSDLYKVAGVDAPDHEGDTVGGLVLGLAERVPEEGEVFSFENLDLTVTRMQGRRVSEVMVAVAERIKRA
ncbi:MAG TPA: hemolysin family protein [Acidimicrobiia bacterium]|nr:hemolysin family protein [Acidimicrobiia bacterium]